MADRDEIERAYEALDSITNHAENIGLALDNDNRVDARMAAGRIEREARSAAAALRSMKRERVWWCAADGVAVPESQGRCVCDNAEEIGCGWTREALDRAVNRLKELLVWSPDSGNIEDHIRTILRDLSHSPPVDEERVRKAVAFVEEVATTQCFCSDTGTGANLECDPCKARRILGIRTALEGGK